MVAGHVAGIVGADDFPLVIGLDVEANGWCMESDREEKHGRSGCTSRAADYLCDPPACSCQHLQVATQLLSLE